MSNFRIAATKFVLGEPNSFLKHCESFRQYPPSGTQDWHHAFVTPGLLTY